jgi:hypothetical protein
VRDEHRRQKLPLGRLTGPRAGRSVALADAVPGTYGVDLVLAILPATGVAAAVGILGWLISSLAPLVTAISWLKYLAPSYYYRARPASRAAPTPCA